MSCRHEQPVTHDNKSDKPRSDSSAAILAAVFICHQYCWPLSCSITRSWIVQAVFTGDYTHPPGCQGLAGSLPIFPWYQWHKIWPSVKSIILPLKGQLSLHFLGRLSSSSIMACLVASLALVHNSFDRELKFSRSCVDLQLPITILTDYNHPGINNFGSSEQWQGFGAGCPPFWIGR